jgi:hypothetical protein
MSDQRNYDPYTIAAHMQEIEERRSLRAVQQLSVAVEQVLAEHAEHVEHTLMDDDTGETLDRETVVASLEDLEEGTGDESWIHYGASLVLRSQIRLVAPGEPTDDLIVARERHIHSEHPPIVEYSVTSDVDPDKYSVSAFGYDDAGSTFDPSKPSSISDAPEWMPLAQSSQVAVAALDVATTKPRYQVAEPNHNVVA